jgi:hydrogenase-4 component E
VVTAIVAYFGNDHELYWVAGALFVLKALVIPGLLKRMARRFAAERELEPYVNTATSLVISGLLVLFGYAITRPLVALSQLPTRAGMPLAMGLVLVSLFVVISRKKALTQVVGFLDARERPRPAAVLGTPGSRSSSSSGCSSTSSWASSSCRSSSTRSTRPSRASTWSS